MLKRLLAILVAVLVLAGGCVVLLQWQATATGRRLAAAQIRWATQAPVHYRLLLSHRRWRYQCVQELEVIRERVTAVHRDTCAERSLAIAPMTVTDLFAYVDEKLAVYGDLACDAGYCLCHGKVVVDVVYDRSLGYPASTAVRFDRSARWRYPAYWWSLWQGQFCPGETYDGEQIRVEALTPLR